jgi:hypothetical protein
MALRVVGSSECLGLVKVGGFFGVFPDIIGEYLQLVGESTQNLWWESSALCERRVLVAAPNATSQPTSVGLLEHAHLRAAPRRTPTPSYCGGTRHVGTLQALDWVSSRCADRHAAVSLYPLLRRRVKGQSQPGRGGGGRGSARHGWRPVSTSVGVQYVLRGEVYHEQCGGKPRPTGGADSLQTVWIFSNSRRGRQCNDHQTTSHPDTAKGATPPAALLALPPPTGRDPGINLAAPLSGAKQDGGLPR